MKPVNPSVYRAALDRVDIAKRALRAIAKGEGPFDRSNYAFACKCIETMKQLATEALAVIENADKWDGTTDNHLRAVTEALRELVVLKDLKAAADELGASPTAHHSEGVRLEAMRAEYRRRKPIAWERARAALGVIGKPPEAAAELIAAVADDILCDVDGFFYYFPKNAGASLSSWMLRGIANELDRRNEPWERELDKHFKETTSEN